MFSCYAFLCYTSGPCAVARAHASKLLHIKLQSPIFNDTTPHFLPRNNKSTDINLQIAPKKPFCTLQEIRSPAMEVLRQPPTNASFVPLAEHQSRTPASFYDGPPILHHHSESCKIVIYERELRACPALAGLGPKAESENGTAGAVASENAGGEGEKEVVIEGVNVWVTSEYVHTSSISIYIMRPRY